jgi:hypothetical protein
MNNAGNTPEKNQEDLLPAHDPIDLKRIKFALLPDKIKLKVIKLGEEAREYDRWFDTLDEEKQLKEYEAFFLDGEGQLIVRSKHQLMEDKAIRMRYIHVIEKLKKEGKLDESYQLK